MLKFLVPAVAVLGLTAVAAQSRAPATAPVAPMGWHVSHEGAMVKLAYGVANSDQLALMLTCEPGQHAAAVYGEVQPAGATVSRAALGPAEPDPLSGGDAAETRIALSDPVMRAFAERGRLQVRGEAGTFALPASRDERRVISDFFAYCASARA